MFNFDTYTQRVNSENLHYFGVYTAAMGLVLVAQVKISIVSSSSSSSSSSASIVNNVRNVVSNASIVSDVSVF